MYLLVGTAESSRQRVCGSEAAKECIGRAGVCTRVLYCSARESVRVGVVRGGHVCGMLDIMTQLRGENDNVYKAARASDGEGAVHGVSQIDWGARF